MKITKTTTKTYDVHFYPNCFPNKTWSQFRDSRKKFNMTFEQFSKCFVCGRKFADDEKVVFITVSGKGNLFGCLKCLETYEASERSGGSERQVIVCN